MEKVEVTINEDGITAKEVNPYKFELDRVYALGHHPSFGLLENFRSHELTLRTFEIKPTILRRMQALSITTPGGITIPREIWEAEVLPNGKIRIL